MKNKNIITLNGKESTGITGLLIQELPPISKPLLRSEKEEIDGRDGDIVTTLGYSAYDKEISIGVYGDYDINEIIAYFNSEGVVTFSNEPDKYYNYQIIQQIDFERLVRYRTATVTFHCQPFKYSTTEGEEILGPATQNLLSIPDFNQTTNGVTLTVSDGVISVSGTPTAATEFYVPTGGLSLSAGTFTLSAQANGVGAASASIRLIGSAPSDSDSLGGNYVTLENGKTVSIQGTLSATKSFGYLWFYITTGNALNFTMTAKVEDEAEKVASDEGTTLMLLNTAEAPFSEFVLKGNTYQASSPNSDDLLEILTVKHQNMIRLTGKNLASINELYLSSGVERTSDGVQATVTSDTLPICYGGSVTNPVGVYTVSFEAMVSNAGEATLVLDSAGIWDSSDLTIKDADGNEASETYRTLGGSWKKYSFTVIAYTSAAWTSDRAVTLYFSTYTNSPVFELRNFQIEVGTTASDYDDSAPQMYPIDFRTGKNMLSEDFLTIGGLDSGVIDLTIEYRVNNALTPIKVNSNSTYTISADLGTTVQGMRVAVQECDGNTIFLQDNGWKQLSDEAYTFTTRGDTEYIKLVFSLSTTSTNVTNRTEDTTVLGTVNEWLRGATLQLEDGDTATAYEEYECIELCKIGGYQDSIRKLGDDWYVHKETGKVVYDGSTDEDWYLAGGGVLFRIDNYDIAVDPYLDYDTVGPILSNYYPAGSYNDLYQQNLDYGISTDPLHSGIYIRDKDVSTVADFKTWLSAHNTTVYFGLSEPTDTKITNETTLETLNALKDQSHAYEGVTFISSLPIGSSDLPIISSVEVAKSSNGTVTNAGNFISKPRLTIYGSGDIGISVDGVQVFQIALGDEEYITIDTATMEAYKDSTENLKNRLVTGDYDNFYLNPGENQITFSGIVTECIVENYSRWL